MECGICFGSLLEKEKQISTTQCGHVYHHECIKVWLLSKQTAQTKICPNCRKMVDINRNVVVYLGDETLHQQVLQVKMSEINVSLDRQNKSITDAFTTMMSMMEELNRQLRKENLEVKDLLRNSQGNGSMASTGMADSQLNEQLRLKDNMIITLRKEIHELKLQRAESAKQLTEIQQHLKNMKRDPLAPKNDQKQPISLSLRFDDFDKMDRADRLIFED